MKKSEETSARVKIITRRGEMYAPTKYEQEITEEKLFLIIITAMVATLLIIKVVSICKRVYKTHNKYVIRRSSSTIPI